MKFYNENSTQNEAYRIFIDEYFVQTAMWMWQTRKLTRKINCNQKIILMLEIYLIRKFKWISWSLDIYQEL